MPNKRAEYDKKYRAENLKKHKAYQAAYYQQNKAASAQRSREYYARRKEKVQTKNKQWFASNAQKAVTYAQKRRALLANNEHSPYDFEEICNRYGNICLCCREQKPLTRDHIVPITRGGGDVEGNIQPLCQGCNSSKGINIIDYRGEL